MGRADGWIWLGAALVLAGVVAAAAPRALAPFDPVAQETAQRLRPPLWRDAAGRLRVLGTDHLGRDILSRVVHGARVSLVIAVVAVAIAGTLGMAFGLGAGYFRGWVDDVVMRAADVLLALPFILLAIALVAVLGPSVGTIIGVLGVTGWVATARVVRAQPSPCGRATSWPPPAAWGRATAASCSGTCCPTRWGRPPSSPPWRWGA